MFFSFTKFPSSHPPRHRRRRSILAANVTGARVWGENREREREKLREKKHPRERVVAHSTKKKFRAFFFTYNSYHPPPPATTSHSRDKKSLKNIKFHPLKNIILLPLFHIIITPCTSSNKYTHNSLTHVQFATLHPPYHHHLCYSLLAAAAMLLVYNDDVVSNTQPFTFFALSLRGGF